MIQYLQKNLEIKGLLVRNQEDRKREILPIDTNERIIQKYGHRIERIMNEAVEWSGYGRVIKNVKPR